MEANNHLKNSMPLLQRRLAARTGDPAQKMRLFDEKEERPLSARKLVARKIGIAKNRYKKGSF
jgi:hypothetical protein